VITNIDGTVIYMPGDNLTDVLLNGESVMDKIPQEAMVRPDGYGYVVLHERIDGDGDTDHNSIIDGEAALDGQNLTLVYWGEVEVQS
jgi:hypothetical protein